jgi:hypothetical protein
MQIREGAYYRTRGGDVVGPIQKNVTGDGLKYYHEDGSFVGAARVMDLISEVYVSDTPPDAPSEDTIIRMNFSEMARTGCKTNSGNVHFFHGLNYIHAHYSVILHWEEGQEPAVPPADAPAPEAKTLRDEFAMAALQGMLARESDLARNVARYAYEYADAMMEARKK